MPPLPNIGDYVEGAERLFALDYVMTMAFGNVCHVQSVIDLEHGKPTKCSRTFSKRRRRSGNCFADDVDWDSFLRDTNRWYDRVVRPREPSCETRQRQFEVLEIAVEQLVNGGSSDADDLLKFFSA